MKDHTYVALDYMSELRELTIPEKLKAQEHIIQFPYTAKVLSRRWLYYIVVPQLFH